MDASAVWASGRLAWPDVELDVADLARHLDAQGADEDPEPTHLEDLYLACACVLAVPGAADAFARNYLGDLRPVLGTLARGRGADFVDEVRQRLAERMLLGEGDTPPRLAQYSGRGPLGAWVRMAAVRCALDTMRQESKGGVQHELDEHVLGGTEGDLGIIKDRYRKEFRDAFRGALASASAESRGLLRLHYMEHVTTDSLAVLHGVSRATIVRRLASAREEVLLEVARVVRGRLRLREGEYASLLGLMRSQIDATLSGLSDV